MDETSVKRQKPNNKEAEAYVVAALLMSPELTADVADILSSEDFYYKQYAWIYEAILQLHKDSNAIDPLTVSNKLKSMGAPDNVSDLQNMNSIFASIPTSQHAKQYAQIVAEASTLRNLLKYTENYSNVVYSGNGDVSDILASAEKDLKAILDQQKVDSNIKSMNEITVDVLDNIEAAAKRKSRITGVPTGFTDLDNKLTGLHGSELILIAARPAMGKTAFALNIAQYACMKKDVPVAVFSLEMSKEQLVSRLLAMDSLVDSQAIRTGQLQDRDWSMLAESVNRVGDMPMYIDDTPGISIANLRAKCRLLKKQYDIGLIVIDYLQLMKGDSRESRQNEISGISRSLKELARELNVPVVALSQLNRAVDSREDHKPVMSDLRESGAIEQDADVIMFIYRDDYYNKETSERPDVADIIVAKQRNGSTGTVELAWMGKFTKFGNLERKKHKNHN